MSASRPEPFTVAVPEDDLAELRRRLGSVRWPEDPGNPDWTYGVDRAWIEEMVAHWRDVYDWRATETAMNRLPQWRVDIDGVPVHYIHVRGNGPSPMPIVVTHGWPWTFWDMRHLIGPLTDPAAHGGDPADAFDVIVPSLPGFGFSGPLRTTGVNVRRVAELWRSLMTDVLGYDRFAAYGGDWGAIVTAELGHAHADKVIGVDMSLAVIPGVSRAAMGPDAWAADEAWMVKRASESERLIRSHVVVHTHDPQTLAYALADSPVGTAAWLWERRRAWSDCDGDVLAVFDRDELCTLASVYWLTGTISTSLRLYFEHFNGGWPRLHEGGKAIGVPTGFSVFPRDVVFLPRSVAERETDLRRWTVMPRGGHFGPAEQPALMVDELRAMFRPLR